MQLSRSQQDTLINYAIERLISECAIPGMKVSRPEVRIALNVRKLKKTNKRKMSAKQRKAVSIRMKKFWAAKRKR